MHSTGIDLACVSRIGQDATQCGQSPTSLASRRGKMLFVQVFGDAEQANAILEVFSENLGDDRGFSRVKTHSGWITGPLRIDAIAVRRSGPGEQDTRPVLAEPSSSHTLGNQRALVFGHRTADL